MRRDSTNILQAFLFMTLWFLIPSCHISRDNSQTEWDEMPFFQHMTGTWQMDGRSTFERWKLVDDGIAVEVFALAGTDTLIKESVKISDVTGVIHYSVTVEGQNQGKPVDFKLTTIRDSMAVFENPMHDFPTRITYSILKNGKLKAVISGPGDEGLDLIEFQYTRK